MFGDLIKVIRTELNITQEQLARELNINISTIDWRENGYTSPSKLTKMRLLEFCSRKSIYAAITSELEKL
jgi:putative transcriptional regulator